MLLDVAVNFKQNARGPGVQCFTPAKRAFDDTRTTGARLLPLRPIKTLRNFKTLLPCDSMNRKRWIFLRRRREPRVAAAESRQSDVDRSDDVGPKRRHVVWFARGEQVIDNADYARQSLYL